MYIFMHTKYQKHLKYATKETYEKYSYLNEIIYKYAFFVHFHSNIQKKRTL